LASAGHSYHPWVTFSFVFKCFLKIPRQLFNQLEKPIAPFARDFSRALSKLQEIPRNSAWFTAVFAPVVIGRSYYSGIGFSTDIWKLL